MITTTKRISFCLTKETERQLKELIEWWGENQSVVITKCVHAMHRHERVLMHPYKQEHTRSANVDSSQLANVHPDLLEK